MTNTTQRATPSRRPASDPAIWAPLFLRNLAEGMSVQAAAKAAGVGKNAPHRLRRKDAEFTRAWLALRPPGETRKGPAKPHSGTGNAAPGKRARAIFLEALADTSNVTAAAAKAGVTRTQVYRLRRSDPVFAAEWYDALAEGYDNLEMELLAHLRAGEGAKGSPKFDSATALRCLAAHRESVTREKGRRTLEQEQATIDTINRRIDEMRARASANRTAIARARRAVAGPIDGKAAGQLMGKPADRPEGADHG
ncbi:hypothetical protein [Qipengyuania sp.]|uniref:hypothetical protein n=1 Tax=Qipengyuania sp. TaxID=2004515 RepID=UPI0035C81AF2